MRLIDTVKDVRFWGLYNREPVLWYSDHIKIGNNAIPVNADDDFGCRNNLVLARIEGRELVYIDGSFTPWPKGRFSELMIYSLTDSTCYENGVSKFSIFKNGKECVFEIPSDEQYWFSGCLCSSGLDVAIVTSNVHKNIFGYSVNGQKLLEYHEKDENLIINGRCIPIVDNIVVVISQEITAAMKLQGFDIRTGKQLWHLDVSERVCPNTFFIGDDKMLYGCDVFYSDTSDLHLCKLNPLTGELFSWNLLTDDKLEVMPWLVTMHENTLYYTDNRRGNEIGVIDVDKKELVERVPLNIDKKVTIGAPVVTDDKVYVFIKDLQELRVYEK